MHPLPTLKDNPSKALTFQAYLRCKPPAGFESVSLYVGVGFPSSLRRPMGLVLLERSAPTLPDESLKPWETHTTLLGPFGAKE